MMFLGNPKPKSSAKLQQRIQRAMDGLPPVRQKILHQNIHNTMRGWESPKAAAPCR
mgnify:CR=1 FL=1